jgi:hypothetical protein
MEIENKTKYYTIEEISIKLGIKNKSTINKISKLGLRKHRTVGPKGNALYTQEQFNAITGNKVLTDLLHNYNVEPVIITYYIYESKMNNPKNKL